MAHGRAGRCQCSVPAGAHCRVLVVAVSGRCVLVGTPRFARGSLARRLGSGTALPAKEAVDVAVQLLEGLCALHERGIVHAALKPSNVLVDEKGRLRLSDYGLADAAGVQMGPSAGKLSPS